MRDEQIRAAFHRKVLQRHHEEANTLVVDELGLKHGQRRADIAVINGHLNGFEIKGDEDSLSRLPGQVEAYSAVFDRATVVVAERHLEEIQRLLPAWWGIVVCTTGPRRALRFRTVRKAAPNRGVDALAVAHLLWKDEAIELLAARGVAPRILKSRRSVLYTHLVSLTEPSELRRLVRERLKGRTSWRCPPLPSRGGGLSLPPARS
jgi:hypothetical protein